MKRNNKGQFISGKSGNPAGKKKGTKHRSTQLREAIEKHGDNIVAALIESALAGDAASIKMALDRIVPTIKPASQPVRFELQGDTLTDKASSILSAIAAGELDPDTGRQLLASVASMARVIEVDELEKRLTALELELEEDEH